ncbi:MAG TPA: phosphotransferase [Pyrinomonadaceae bacterium]|jgi:thiamine kinase-like enzyme|nr:phosphotransferase [Pyrinomonadaceae bacterium]
MNPSEVLEIAKRYVEAADAVCTSEQSTSVRDSLFAITLVDGRRVMMKFYDSAERFDCEVAALRTINETTTPHSPRLLLSDRRHLITFLEKLHGRNWTAVLTYEPLTVQCHLAEQIGKELRSLHSVSLGQTRVPRAALDHLIRLECNDLPKTSRRISTSVLVSDSDRTHCYDLLQTLHSNLRHSVGRIDASGDNESALLEKAMLHGDLWAGNIFVSSTDESTTTVLLDYEYAMIGERIIDLARIFSRGFVARDASDDYQLMPNEQLWTSFAKGYGLRKKNIADSVYFRRAVYFSLVRTVNYYGLLLEREQNSDRVDRYLQALKKISLATLRSLNSHTLSHQ